ncbi:MAG: undecaprenyl-diphosphate phosphatase [Candidatus Bathyarchaeota archaeon]|nr:undecaprenyl-diphosphate phosphatase [Candidatus Bathyarchaeota archaeon]
MDLLQSIILGFIQGTTEWLPISSTGHLRLAEIFFGLSVPLLFDVTLHVGTLFVILFYFRRDLKNVLTALWHRDLKSPDGKLIVPIIIGSIPTGAIALLVGNDLDIYFSTLLFLGVGFIVSGVFLLATRFTKETKSTISPLAALLIGIMQGLSIVPSISRSGFTIATALLLGIKKEVAFKFSFLLSIPAIIGALGVTLYQEGSGVLLTSGIGMLELVAALAVTVAVSFVALKILWKVLTANKFYLFAIYCFAMGAVLIVLSLLGF